VFTVDVGERSMTSLIAVVVLAAAASPAPASPGAASSGSASPARPSQPAVAELTTAADARTLCDALVPEDRIRPSGSPLEGADARARLAAARAEATGRLYRAVIPGERLRFAAYDLEEAVLSLRPHAPLAAGDGALRLHPSQDSGLPVEADRAAVERILAARDAGQLALALTFALPEDDPSPCFQLAGAPSIALAAEPIAWEYRAGDTLLARGGEGADRPLVSAKEGATPRVRLGPVEEGTPVRAAVEGRLGDLEGCYRTALDRDPWLDGAVVADLDPAAQGPRIAADTLQDDAMVGCVRTVLARVEPAGDRAFVPIHFELSAPAAK
jgi:hypothetical protein